MPRPHLSSRPLPGSSRWAWGAIVALACLIAATPVRAAAVDGAQLPCSWNHPGRDPYTGRADAAVDDYRDIAPDIRARLKARLAGGRPDDTVAITRDAIAGGFAYAPEIADMHFGAGKVCRRVTRARWRPGHTERALVFCDGATCLLVPAICGNVSRVRRLPDPAAEPAGPGASAGGGGAGNVGNAKPAPVLVSLAAPDSADHGVDHPADAIDITPAAGPTARPDDTPPLAFSTFQPVLGGGLVCGCTSSVTRAASPVPEPAPIGLLAAGLLVPGLARWARRTEHANRAVRAMRTRTRRGAPGA